MIDINELRNDAKTAHYGHLPLEVSGSEMLELLDRLEAAESECLEEARLNGMGSEREAALMAKLEAAEKAVNEAYQRGYETGQEEVEKERDAAELMSLALQAKIAEMERQEPVAFALYSGRAFKAAYHKEHEACDQRDRRQLSADLGGSLEAYRVVPLYALPGAKEQEPTRDWWDCLIADISAIDCMYRGSPTYAHDAYWMRDHVVWMLKKRRDALPGAQGEEK